MNNQGFALYSFVIFAPLFLTLTLMASWTFWFLNQKHQLDNLCQHFNLKAQEVLLKHNNYVLSLNNRAWALILEKRSLDAIILAAPPPAKAAARIRRRMVVAQQYILKNTQKALITKANFQSQLQAYRLRKVFKNKVRQIENFWNSSPRGSKIKIYWQKSRIKPRFKEIAPPYKRSTQHDSLQEIKVYWSLPLQSISPKWLKSFLPLHHNWQGQCFSHPKKRRTKWIAQTGRAKPLSKLLF